MNGNRFGIIYADPAWTYNDKALSGNRGAGCKYALMTDTDLQALPVEALAADDCVLFLWATMPKLREALDLMPAWGFTYKTCAFTWVKRWSSTSNTWFMGMGSWTRANAELVLLGTRGKPRRISAGVGQIIDAPRGKHSRKPDIVRDKIVSLMGDVPRVELFARESCPGWVSLGADIDGRDLRESIPALVSGIS